MPERGARRWLTFLLAAALALSLAACTGGADERPAPPATTPIAATATDTPTAPPAPIEPPTTPTPSPTSTATPTPAATAVPSPTATPAPTSTATPTPTPSEPPTTFRYDRYDTSGEVAEPGSYAFLADPADTRSAITTYEGLRDGSATALRIHETDADGVSRAAFLDTVEVGDLFEWRQAEDCFVRYTVTEVLPDPSGTPRKLLGVEWMTFTYTGCSGAISASDNAQIVWGSLPNLGGESLSVPVIHGAYEIVPLDWSGETMRDSVPFPDYSDPVETDDITVARTLDFWREPTIPEGWTFGKAIAAGGDAYGGARWGYCATWWANDVKIPNTTVVHPQRGVQICADFTSTRYGNQDASWNNGSAVHETRVIAGRPASLRFSPPGPNHRPGFPTLIQVFDPTTGVTYEIEAIDYDLKSNPEAVVEMARSLFEPPNPLPPPTTFRYDRYDTTGEVAEPGSYAFLANPADTTSAVTTYEGLRDGSATALRIHEADADGVSRAAFLDTVEVGDLFEWRQAEDCFVRYRLTGVSAASGDTREFAIKSYSHTYTGCSGAIGGSGSAGAQSGRSTSGTATTSQFTWAPVTLKTGAFTAPTWHGPSLVIPKNWAGPVPATAVFTGPSISWPPSPLPAPNLGTGWSGSLGRGYPDTELDGIYTHTDGGHLLVYIFQLGRWPIATYRLSTTYAAPGRIYEFRMIDGRHAVVSYDRVRTVTSQAMVVFYDEATGLVYTVRGGPKSRKNDPEATIDLARKFILPPAGPPPTTFRYDAYDTSGEVAAPGSYAFLANLADAASAVTTYEGLRDGSATALRIHETDADGVSRAAFLDTVEVGDTFEWKEADDCFVRYTVTAVKPDPAGTVPRKLLGVESIAYAFTGCSGAIATGSASGSAANSASSSTASVTWGALPNLGGTSLTVPIVQGPFQLVPAGWTGATKPVGPRFPAGPTIPFAETTSLAEARTLPHWREPELPEGWTFTYAWSGDEVEVGYFEAFYNGLTLTVSASGINAKYSPKAASATYTNDGSQTSVRETRQIAGRPARVHRSITAEQFPTTVHVWDEATGVLYTLHWSGHATKLIALAQSMFE